MKEYEKSLKIILDVYKTTTFRTFSSNGLNILQTQLEYLAAKGLISIVPHDGNSFDYQITVADKALTYFDDIAAKRVRFWLPIVISNAIAVAALIVAILAYLK